MALHWTPESGSNGVAVVSTMSADSFAPLERHIVVAAAAAAVVSLHVQIDIH